jgi:hypothetical protein
VTYALNLSFSPPRRAIVGMRCDSAACGAEIARGSGEPLEKFAARSASVGWTSAYEDRSWVDLCPAHSARVSVAEDKE